MTEGVTESKMRWAKLHMLQAHYSSFIPFLEDGMAELGFSATDIQHEIGNWMEHGPQYLMVQAQRGQAKTTVAALFAVWCLIHSPAHRVLIISAGGTQANEISTLIVRLIMSMEVLECLRPDKMAGDRTSVEAFDVHHSLKGLDKSPSVACVGIDSNLQGKRADLLIADDVESGKNSATAVQRAKLLHITKDFTSINSTGRILWLGTPQTMDSIYNSLAVRGVSIRIWPGRYPTEVQRKYYGANLAPSIQRKLQIDPTLASGGGTLGNQGQAIDPMILDEQTLQKKELDQGEAYFQLQHMLNTTLSDAMRHPLKPEKLVMLSTDGHRMPLVVVRGMFDTHRVDKQVCDFPFKLSIPHETSKETALFQSIWAYVDPAPGGANGDETAYAVGAFLNGNVILLSVGGIPGGYEEEKLEELAKRITKFKIDGVTIEKNMGFGAFRQAFTPVLRKFAQCQIDDDLVTGQKEARIINTLAPVMGRGALLVDEAVIDEDRECCARYAPSLQQSYSLFHQLAKISMARGALTHDDRVDAVEGVVRHFQESIAQDQKKRLASVQAKAFAESIKDPCGHDRYNTRPTGRASMLKRRR
jgi:hypothetical protein